MEKQNKILEPYIKKIIITPDNTSQKFPVPFGKKLVITRIVVSGLYYDERFEFQKLLFVIDDMNKDIDLIQLAFANQSCTVIFEVYNSYEFRYWYDEKALGGMPDFKFLIHLEGYLENISE